MYKYLLILLISSVLALVSCLQKNKNEDFINNRVEVLWSYDDSLHIYKRARFFDDRIQDLMVYNSNFVKLQKQIYKDTVKDSIIVYYDNGNIQEVRDYIDYLNEGPILNTYINYDKQGEIVEQKSCSYKFVNAKSYYHLNEDFQLRIQIIGGEVDRDDRKLQILVANYNDFFFHDVNSLITYDFSDNSEYVELNLPTFEMGDNIFRFQLNEIQTSDSGYWVRPMFITYNYKVFTKPH